MNGAEIVIYIFGVIIICLISICLRIYCRRVCKDDCSDEDSCDGCYECCCDDSQPHPSHTSSRGSNSWLTVQQQPLQNSSSSSYGYLSTAPLVPVASSSLNRTNFQSSQNALTIFPHYNSSQTSTVISSAPQLSNNILTSAVLHVNNTVSESHRSNVSNIQSPLNSNFDDPPPAYASVISKYLSKGYTQYPRVAYSENEQHLETK